MMCIRSKRPPVYLGHEVWGHDYVSGIGRSRITTVHEFERVSCLVSIKLSERTNITQ